MRVSSDRTVAAGEDSLGQPLGPVTWPHEFEVWASRRDIGAQEINPGPGSALQPLSLVNFTIRYNADVTRFHYVIDKDGQRYDQQGPPLLRGLRGGGARYMELRTKLSILGDR